jgi:hypothetical protein
MQSLQVKFSVFVELAEKILPENKEFHEKNLQFYFAKLALAIRLTLYLWYVICYVTVGFIGSLIKG